MKIYRVSVEIPSVYDFKLGDVEWNVYARFFSTVEGAEKFATRFRDTPYLHHKDSFINLRDKEDHFVWGQYYYNPHVIDIKIEEFEIDNFSIFSNNDAIEWDIG